MKNFIHIATNIPVAKACEEVTECAHWIYIPSGDHEWTHAIHLRAFNPNGGDKYNDLDMYNYPGKELPEVWKLVEQMRCLFQGDNELGRVMVVGLDPGRVIKTHADTYGKYMDHYVRFHLPLQSDIGNVFICGDEALHMKPGNVYWFNHKQPHAVGNTSWRPRFHLMVDLPIEKYRKLAIESQPKEL